MPTHLQSLRLCNIFWSTGAANPGSTEQRWSEPCLAAVVSPEALSWPAWPGRAVTHSSTNSESLRAISPPSAQPRSPLGHQPHVLPPARALLVGLCQGQAWCWLCRERGQGLNSGLGELKYSKHKADVALPRLHGNQRHVQPLLWQHMCAVYLEDPRCLLFFFFPV